MQNIMTTDRVILQIMNTQTYLHCIHKIKTQDINTGNEKYVLPVHLLLF